MKRLVLIDDDPFALKMMEDLFRKEWKIINETIAEKIIEKYRSNPPELMLLNTGLRRTDGDPTFDALRSAMPDTPIIVYGPSNTVKTGREMVKRGAFWNLVTPLNTIDLEHVMSIAMTLEQHRQKMQDTQDDFAQLEEGIVRMSLPLRDTLPDRFTFEQDDLLQGIVDLLADVLEVEKVSLMLLDSFTGELRIKAAKGLHQSVIRNTVKRLGEGIAGWVAKEGKPLFVKDVGQDENFSESPFFDQYSSKSLICVPLKTGDRVVGVLNANNKKSGGPFEEHELYLTTIFSHILLMTLQNAQSHFDRERMLVRESSLSQLHRKISGMLDLKTLFHAILEECCTIYQSDSGVFFLLDEKGTEITAYSLSKNQFTETELPPTLLRQWVAVRRDASLAIGPDTKKFGVLPGIVKDKDAWIAVPVTFQDRMIGSLELGSSDRRAFHESDLQSLLLVGQQAALAVHNARLYEKLLTSLKEISEARKEVDKVRRGQFL